MAKIGGEVVLPVTRRPERLRHLTELQPLRIREGARPSLPTPRRSSRRLGDQREIFASSVARASGVSTFWPRLRPGREGRR